MSSNWAPSDEPNVGERLRSCVRSTYRSPLSMTWNRWMSNAPAWKSPAVGYAYVPGPLSSPSGSLTSNTTVPVTKSELTTRCAKPVARPLVAAAVMTLLPSWVGSSAVNVPLDLVDTVVVAPPASVAVAAMSIRVPAGAVPVTFTVGVDTWAGASRVIAMFPGGPWSTYRARTSAGCSTGWPAMRLCVSRTVWAWAQVSGDAEPTASPGSKPMDAVVGSVPDLGRAGFSQICS